jgi:hypothetical protein
MRVAENSKSKKRGPLYLKKKFEIVFEILSILSFLSEIIVVHIMFITKHSTVLST